MKLHAPKPIKFGRSSSVKSLNLIGRDLRGRSRSTRASALSLTRKMPMENAYGTRPSISQSGVFSCAQISKNDKVKKEKETVSAIQLHRKIFNMDRVIEKQENNIKKLKMKVAVSGHPGQLPCCCDELRTIFDDKENKLMQLSDYWRTKT